MGERVDNTEVRPESPLFPFRLLGMGFFLAWYSCLCFSEQVLSPLYQGPLSVDFFLSNTTSIVCLICVALFAKRIGRLSQKDWVVWAAGILATGRTILLFFGTVFPIAEVPLLVVGSAASGAGFALSFLAWNELYSTFPTRLAGTCYAGSYLISVILYFVIATLTPLAATLALCVLPIASSVLLALSNRAFPRANRVEEDVDSHEFSDSMSWEFPLKPTILMMLYSFAFYFFLHLTGGSSVIDQIGIALLALPVLIASLHFFDRFDVRILYKLALPLMVAGLLIHSQLGVVGGTIASVMTNASFVGFTVFAQIILCNICYRYNVRAIWLFGIVYTASMLAHIIGSCVGHWVSVEFGYPSSVAGMVVILVVICLVLTSMLLLDEHGFSTTWGITPLARSDEARNEHSVILMSYYEEFVWRCARVSRHYGLTHREEEVLALLAQRKSIAAIESSLFISHGTAKGHVLHIYAKLGVHSRDEVAQIVESIK